jgi:hypothetical protein
MGHNVVDWIHGDRFESIADLSYNSQRNGPMTVRSSSDDPSIVFCKTDFLASVNEVLWDLTGPITLITHNSDLPVTQDMWDRRPECVTKWYGINITCPGPIPIPIGIERPGGGGYSANIADFEWALTIPRTRTNLVLACFNPDNGPVRHGITAKYRDRDWITWLPYPTPFREYLAAVRSHPFVLCPAGNGLDCHREWEALYLGALPIILPKKAFPVRLDQLSFSWWERLIRGTA